MTWEQTVYIQTSFSQDNTERIDKYFNLPVNEYGKYILMESVSNWDTPIVRIFILIENDNLDNFNSFISKNYILDDTVRSGDEIRSKEGIWLFEKQYTHTRSKIKLNKYSEHNAWTMWYVECQTLFQPIQNMIELEGKQVKRPIQNLWINEWV